MIGLILTGHGRFAEGMASGLKMIAGEIASMEVVNFLENDSTEDLEQALAASCTRLDENCDGILFCCDLLGGTPFKTAATLSVRKANSAVLSGVNLPTLLEMLFTRLEAKNAHAYATSVLCSETIKPVKFEIPTAKVVDEQEEGI